MMIGILQINAQWQQSNITLSDISVGSATNIVAVDYTSTSVANAGNLMQLNTTSGAWAYYTSESPFQANITHASIAEDGTIWYRRDAQPGTPNLYRKASNEGAFSLTNGHLTCISVGSACSAVGNYLNVQDNIYKAGCAPVTYSLANPNTQSSYCAIGVDGTIVAINGANGTPLISVSNGTFVVAASQTSLSASHVSVGNSTKIIAVSNGNLYFKSGNFWIQDTTAPANVIKASVAADGTMALLTSGENNLYFNTWDNMFCTVPAAPVLNTDSYVQSCEGDEVTLSVQDLGYDVEWYSSPISGGTLLGTGNPYTFIANGNGANSMYVSPQLVNGGCISPRTTLLLGIATNPEITINSIYNTCPNVPVTVSFYSPDYTTVFWSTGGESDTEIITPSESTTVELTLTNNQGCSTTEEIQINVDESPELTVTGPTEYCQPSGWIASSISFNVSGSNGPFEWFDGSTESFVSVFPTETTTYTVTSELAENCIATGEITVEYLLASVEQVQVTTCPSVYPLTVDNVDYFESGVFTQNLGSNVAGCDSIRVVTIQEISTELSFSNGNIQADPNGQSYAWYDCNTGQIAGFTEVPTFTPPYNGEFYAAISVNVNPQFGTCQTITECISTIVGVDELSTESIGVYPNPANERITLSHIKIGDTVVITDATGKETLQLTITNNQQTIDVSSLSSGVYFVRSLKSKNAPTKLFISK